MDGFVIGIFDGQRRTSGAWPPRARRRHAIKSMIPIDSSIRYKMEIKEQDVDDIELGALVSVGTQNQRIFSDSFAYN